MAAPAAIAAIADQNDASHCLKVDSDGSHWGFRNGCDFAVQFAYCMAGGADSLTACGDQDAVITSVSGSVAANSFGALMADNSLQEKDAAHNFRWIACGGGAGEVVAHLDHSEPPAGAANAPAPRPTERRDWTMLKTRCATIALFALGFALANPALAADCASPAEAAALKTAVMQQELMVAALQCHEAGAYNRFVINYRGELQDSDAALKAFFVRRGGEHGEAGYDTFKTKAANLSALEQARDARTFCADAHALFTAALANRGSLMSFVDARAGATNIGNVCVESRPAPLPVKAEDQAGPGAGQDRQCPARGRRGGWCALLQRARHSLPPGQCRAAARGCAGISTCPRA